MSIEINAKVNRENAIFMAGECFVVSVSLRNTDEIQPNSLAWGCVQLHCDQVLSKAASVDDGQKQADQSAHRHKTSVPRAKRAIYSSTPAIIFCDVRLKPREMVQFEHSIDLPLHLPPSFKGHFVKYHWYVSVAVQHVDAPIKVLQLPLKIVNVTVDVLTPQSSDKKEEDQLLENPFLSRDKNLPSIVDIAASKVEEVTSVRTSRVFEMKNSGGVFAVITMFKHFYKLGDEIVGRITFPQPILENSIHCLQVLVRLETIEINLYGNKREEHISHIFTEHFVTAFVKETHFKLPILLSSVPAFSTEAVQLRWRLHFEFVTSKQIPMKFSGFDAMSPNSNESNAEAKNDGEEVAKLAAELNIETMAWDMYISVHSCNPHNIALTSNVPSSSALRV